MRVLIVHAHPEPTSFNGALTREATAALAGAGHEVVVSDLSHAERVEYLARSRRRPFADRRWRTTTGSC